MLRYRLALFGSCFGLGITPVLVRLSDVDPTTSLWLRMASAAVVLVTFALISRRGRSSGIAYTPFLLLLIAFSGASYAFDMLANHLAVIRTTVANTALLMNISPLFVIPAAFVLYGERQAPSRIAGLVAALVGVGLLVGGSFEISADNVIGDGLAVLSAAIYAAYLLVTKKVGNALSPDRIVMWNCVVASVVLLPLAMEDGAIPLPVSSEGWLVIAAMALGSQILGNILLLYGMNGTSASLASLALLLQPVAAAAVAWVTFGEHLTGVQIVGCLFVLAGLGAATLTRSKPVPEVVATA